MFINKKQKGFTLIELIIVMGILVIVVAISFNSLVKSQDFQIFNNNFIKLQSLINNARSQAITGKGQLDYTDFDHDLCNHNGAMVGGSCTAPDYVTPANYGISLDTSAGTTNVKLFADINPPPTGATGQKGRFDNGTAYTTGDDLVLDSLGLPTGISLEVVDTSGAKTSGSMFFSPNYADITFDGLSVSPFLKLRLRETGGTSQCKQIKIHKLAGIPEVEACS